MLSGASGIHALHNRTTGAAGITQASLDFVTVADLPDIALYDVANMKAAPLIELINKCLRILCISTSRFVFSVMLES